MLSVHIAQQQQICGRQVVADDVVPRELVLAVASDAHSMCLVDQAEPRVDQDRGVEDCREAHDKENELESSEVCILQHQDLEREEARHCRNAARIVVCFCYEHVEHHVEHCHVPKLVRGEHERHIMSKRMLMIVTNTDGSWRLMYGETMRP